MPFMQLGTNTGAGSLQSGATAQRPVAGVADRYFFDTTTNVLYRDTGTAWQVVAGKTLGAVTTQAAPGQTGALGMWRESAGALMAIMRPDGKLMIRPKGTSPLDKSVAEFTTPTYDSRVTIGEGTAGADDPAITFYRTGSGGAAGYAYRIRQPDSFNPLRIEASISGSVAYGTETYATRLRVGAGNSTGHPALMVHRIAGQTGDLLQFFDENGAGLPVRVAANGDLEAPNVTGTWVAYTPTWTSTGTGQPVLGDGTLTARFKQIGKTVHFDMRLAVGTTTTFGDGNWLFNLPAASRVSVPWHAMGQSFDASTNARPMCISGNQNATTIFVRTYDGLALNGATPWVWANGDTLTLSGTFEAA